VDVRYQWWGTRALGVLGLLVAACATVWWIVGTGPVDRDPEAAAPSQEAGSSTVVAGRRLPEAVPARRLPGDPLRLTIPAIDVDAPVVPILAPGGVLTPPSDPLVLGWWADGARPGEFRGSALVTGHTIHTGGGALDDLDQLDDGDTIRVHLPRKETSYAVQDVEVLTKGELAEEAELLFSQAVPGRLVVVTCEDWNGSEYLSNVVVTATPTGAG
jgi:LPXTG-site transpeptidase (sortase) family protein